MADNNVNDTVEYSDFFWLDTTIEKSNPNRDTKSLLRQIARGRLKTFADSDECVDSILNKLDTDKICLIVSSSVGAQVVPFIHEWPQIQTIYIYCGNRQRAEQWTRPYTKITGIFTDKKTLLNKICDDIGAHGRDSELPMSVFHLEEKQNSLQNLTSESATFMWYQSILHVIPLMAKYCNSKIEMIRECRAKYHNDEIEQKKIDGFEQNYKPEKAIWWYTYDSCIYRLLNRALRTQNTEIIFKFRFFINDLHNQILELYQQYLESNPSNVNHSLTLYRGQRMKIDEIYRLQGSVNQLISMNSFLSATTIKELAEIFADTSDQANEASPLQSVLFTINICNMTKETTPFAFIQNFSCCRDEQEVLFSIGAIFKVVSVKKDNNTWHVNFQLCNQQNELCQDVFKYMRKEIGSDPSPISFGWFLYRTSKFEKVERYANILLKEFPENGKEIGNVYNLLGLTYKAMNRLDQAVEYYEKALNIFGQHGLHNSSNVIATHYNAGLAYLALGNNEKANEHQNLAEGKLINSSNAHHPLLFAQTDSLKAQIQAVNGDYASACKNLEEVLKKKKKQLPEYHPSIASTLNELGIVHEKMNNDEKAFKCFTEVLEICTKCLASDNLEFAKYRANIGRIYFKREEYTLALEQFELALKIYRDFTREDTEDTELIEKCITETRNQIDGIRT
ncbi:unnamed protein product [Adineta steineri]|uniref:NAD(P)(+)--arginine ADP-ribosyltransferase n=2 Tax=Adineta steineri TaxID=433720 RepID=A0A818UV27_9BILA|nr:unnamed protein product [Adineta steineri]CAF3698031.1 unnamed protein product [Adineta steineri]